MSTAVACGGAAGALAGLALVDVWVATGAPQPTAAAGGPGAPRAGAAARRGGIRRATELGVPLLIVGALIGLLVLGLVGMPVGAGVAAAVIRQGRATAVRRSRRQQERGTGPLARSLADAIRGGLSLRAALAAAAVDRSVPGALRTSVGSVTAAQERGMPLAAALADLAPRGGPQLGLLAALVALHAERGGALARELDALADDAERAVRLDEERASATVQARATVRTVAALPLFALAAAQLIGGDFLSSLARNPIALALLLLGVTLEAVAILVARRLVARLA